LPYWSLAWIVKEETTPTVVDEMRGPIIVEVDPHEGAVLTSNGANGDPEISCDMNTFEEGMMSYDGFVTE